MDEIIEIELNVNNKVVCEYYSNSVPRIGEKINLNVSDIKGEFIITDVKHEVFETERSFDRSKKIVSYVKVYATTMYKKRRRLTSSF